MAYHLFYIIIKLYKAHIIFFLLEIYFAVFFRKVHKTRAHARTPTRTHAHARARARPHIRKPAKNHIARCFRVLFQSPMMRIRERISKPWQLRLLACEKQLSAERVERRRPAYCRV